MAGAEVQKAGRADIRNQPDPGFRHRQERTFGGDPVPAVHRDAGAPAHRDAIDERQIRLREPVYMPDDLVLFAEENRSQLAIAGDAASGLVNCPDIAAGAEGALTGPADQESGRT